MLLSHLVTLFKDRLGVACRHRKNGTLVYHKQGDILQALYWSLGQTKLQLREHSTAATPYQKLRIDEASLT